MHWDVESCDFYVNHYIFTIYTYLHIWKGVDLYTHVHICSQSARSLPSCVFICLVFILFQTPENYKKEKQFFLWHQKLLKKYCNLHVIWRQKVYICVYILVACFFQASLCNFLLTPFTLFFLLDYKNEYHVHRIKSHFSSSTLYSDPNGMTKKYIIWPTNHNSLLTSSL